MDRNDRSRSPKYAPVRGEYQFARVGNERAGHRRQARNRLDEAISGTVDYLDRVIAGMRDVQPVGSGMDIGVIESALPAAGWKIHIPDPMQ
jgi:hypothetical protein